MDKLVLLLMLSIMITRLIASVTFIDYYYRTKRKSFIFLILGWSTYCLSPLFNILSDNGSNNFLYFFYYYFATLGSLMIIFAGINYFREVNYKIIIASVLLVTFTPIVVYLITSSHDATYFIEDIFQFTFLFIAIITALIKRSHFKEIAGNSLNWFVAITVLSITNAASFLFFSSDDTIVYNYLLSYGISILGIIFFVHLEHNISIKKTLLLKDHYSHNLGNIIQIILGEIEMISLTKGDNMEELLQIKDKCLEATVQIKKIRKL